MPFVVIEKDVVPVRDAQRRAATRTSIGVDIVAARAQQDSA